MKKYFNINLSFISVIFLIIFLTGCGVWRDFTGYFNGYYNAANLFEDAETQINKDKKELFALQDPPLSATVSQNLNKVIEKLSKLLQFNSQSNLVDDALMMIGKSFYYQKNYQKASRKFIELVNTYPESGLVLEAKLWTAKSYFKINAFDNALEVLNEVYKLAEEKKENSIMVSAYIEEISYLISKEKVDDAISKCNKLVEVSHDDVISASVMFELGKLYKENGQLENSAKAYAAVQNYSPDFETEYNAKLEYGKIQSELGKYEKSYSVFEGLREKQIYNEFLDKTDLEMGIALIKLKRTEEAFDKLRLIDTAFVAKPSSGIAAYYLGGLIENEFADFDSAKYYYSKVGPSSAPLEIKELAAKKVQILNKLTNLHSTIDDFSRKLLYLVDSTAFKKDSLAYLREQAIVDSLNKESAIKDELNSSNQKEIPEQNNSNRQQGGQQGQKRNNRGQAANDIPQKFINKMIKPTFPTISLDSIKVVIVKYEYELAGLFFTELNIPDSTNYYYMDILNNYSNSPYTARTLFALGTYYSTMKNKQKADSLFEIVYNNYQTENIVNAAAQELNKPMINIKHDPADSLYKNAESKIKSENYKEAVADFFNIYKQYPSSQFAPKALYASGWLLENKLELLDSAAVIYDSLSSKYRNTIYANAVRVKLNNYKMERKAALTPKDSIKSTKDTSGIKLNKEKLVKNTAADTTKKETVNITGQPKKLSEGILRNDSTTAKEKRFPIVADSIKKQVQIPPKDTVTSKKSRE
jgi:TolA-binding protein